ncbi:hypothetical protein [Huintestinicola sp.]
MMQAQWVLSTAVFAFGLLFWVITYIAAPLQSRKEHKHISGVPGTAFVIFLLGGLLSPCKWLALLCLLDFSVTALPFYLLVEFIKKKLHKDK